jgi:dipeptidyl aminopeptidase/acylaminoacyl peptidase
MSAQARARTAGVVLIGACSQHPPTALPTAAETEAIHIVATERGPGGGILVVIGEDGNRVGALVAAPGGGDPIRDTAPAFSPDGKWVVFSSSRGRRIDESSLWAVPAGFDATPVRLTDTTAIDMTPAWTSDGAAIVYASSKSGSLDLWRLAVEERDGALRARGAPEQLTSAPGQELSPTVAPDGRIAYASLTVDADGATKSTIEVRSPSGQTETVAPGPGDASPRYDPAGKRLAFTRPTLRTGEAEGDGEAFSAIDADLWIVDAAGTRRIVELPFTDESGPVWSIDGRWLFATSLVRKVNGEPLLSSVIHVDLEETDPVPRMLIDRAGAVTRLSPAVAPVVLDATALHRAPIYVDELKRIIRDAVERNPTNRE